MAGCGLRRRRNETSSTARASERLIVHGDELDQSRHLSGYWGNAGHGFLHLLRLALTEPCERLLGLARISCNGVLNSGAMHGAI
jgi:hypothetical protein